MASFKQLEYCPTCQKTVTTDNGICKACGSTVLKRNWAVRFRLLTEDGVKQKVLSGYKTKREAKEAYINFMAGYIAPTPKSEDSEITLGRLYEAYYRYIQDRLKPASIYETNSIYKRVIEPYFGANIRIIDITKRDIMQWQNHLNTLNYSYKSKTKYRGYLYTLLKFAMQYYDIPNNVVSQVTAFRNLEAEKEMKYWNAEEFQTFISCIDDDIVYKTFFSFLYLTGCRKGEAQALSWKDIDLVKGAINITKNITRKTTSGPYEITTPKNKTSVRKITIPIKLVELLKEYLNSLDNISKGKFVFGGDTPLSDNTIKRRMQKYCELSGVEVIRIHDLRHSHVSFLISSGVNIVAIAKRLGHKDIQQTLNTYAHMLKSDEEAILNALNVIEIA